MLLRAFNSADGEEGPVDYIAALKADPDGTVDIDADDSFTIFFPKCVRADDDGALTSTYSEIAQRLMCTIYIPSTDAVDGRLWGTHAIDVDVFQTHLDTLVEAGLEPKEYDDFASFYKDVKAIRAPFATDLAITVGDYFLVERAPAPVAQAQPLKLGWLEAMPLHAPASSDGFCDSLGDLESYMPNHLCYCREDGSDLAWMGTHLFDQLSWVDQTVRSLPPSRVGQRILTVLLRTTWPACLWQECSAIDDKYEDITDRAVLYNGAGASVKDFGAILSRRAPTLLRSEHFEYFTEFLEDFTDTDAWVLMLSTARLFPESAVSTSSITLDSLEAVGRVNAFLKPFREAFEHTTIKALAPEARILWLEGLLKSQHKRPVRASVADAGALLTELDENDASLHAKFNTSSSMSLESQILKLCKDKPEGYANTVFDLIAASDEDLFKKCALGYIRNPGVRPVFKSITTLLPYWEQWANLRLVWDGTSVVTANMRRFRAAAGFWTNMKGMRWQKINILTDVYAEYYRQILLVRKPVDKLTSLQEPLLDTYLTSQDKLFGDRAFSALGYKSVEKLGSVSDSYAALSDKTGDFWESGIALRGSEGRIRKHARYAMDFHSGVIAEACTEFSVWAKSSDALHPFPTRFVPLVSPAREELASKEAQVTKLLAALDYESSSEDSDPDIAPRRKKARDKRNAYASGSEDEPQDRTKPAPKRGRLAPAPRPPAPAKPKSSPVPKAGPKKGKAKVEPPPPKAKLPLPAPSEVPIGGTAAKVTIVETATSISINGSVNSKADLAKACRVGTGDLCWAVAVSAMPWPLKLRLCNHAGEPGHESHDSSKHNFTEKQLVALRTLLKQE